MEYKVTSRHANFKCLSQKQLLPQTIFFLWRKIFLISILVKTTNKSFPEKVTIRHFVRSLCVSLARNDVLRKNCERACNIHDLAFRKLHHLKVISYRWKSIASDNYNLIYCLEIIKKFYDFPKVKNEKEQ